VVRQRRGQVPRERRGHDGQAAVDDQGLAGDVAEAPESRNSTASATSCTVPLRRLGIEHPAVPDSAVVGLPDPRRGELVVAYVFRLDETLTAEDCDKHCREHPMLAGCKRPRAYRFVTELPATATGKKMHYKVREMAIADDAGGRLLRP
jgi:hypothetical protein